MICKSLMLCDKVLRRVTISCAFEGGKKTPFQSSKTEVQKA